MQWLAVAGKCGLFDAHAVAAKLSSKLGGYSEDDEETEDELPFQGGREHDRS